MQIEIVLHYFTQVYSGFLFQILIGEALIVCKFKRKPLFWVRLAAGGLCLAALTFVFSCLQLVMPDNPITGALPYIFLFAFTVVIMKMCFGEQWKFLVLCGVAAYSLQNTVYRLMSLCEITGLVWNFYELLGNYNAAYYIILTAIELVFYTLAYFLFVRRINAKGIENIYSRNVLLISVVSLGITVFLCSYVNAFWWQGWHLSIINYCFTILCNVFILAILSGMFENVGLRNDIETVRQLWLQDKRQYELAKENIDLINIKCHDLKHKIHSLRLAEDGVSADELKEIEKAVAIYDSKVSTGSDPIDVLLTEKSLLCLKRGIRLTCMIDSGGFGFMSESELYSLFGNMLSNAMQAVSDLEEREKRVIGLTVSRKAGMIMINCVNYFNGEITLKNGVPLTKKEDKSLHGFGVKSMQMLVRKYGGEMFFAAENGVFDLKIMLPETVKEENPPCKIC
ncbi:MAG: ATP-binding protein [Clostridia bacterium]|nr:ATP-binding protein [Clostridia bacterium]